MPVERANRTRRQVEAPHSRPLPPPTPPATSVSMTDPDGLDTDRSPLPTDARQLTRMVQAFWSPRAVLNAAVELRRAVDDDTDEAVRAAASQLQKTNFELYDELDRLRPDLFDLIASRENSFGRNVRDKLKEGRNGAKAEDNNKVKNAIVHWRNWSPPLRDEPKTRRGLNHPECAWWLSPIEVDFDNAEQRRQFMECGNPPMLASNWPRLLWRDGIGNISKPSEGLFQSKLLVDAATAILKSPSAVLPSTSARPGVAKRGRKGLATKYHLSKVTPAFLAYVAVVVRFALSSEDTFSDDGGTFKYTIFYSQLRTYLEGPKFRKQAKVLLNWWNRTLFPEALYGVSDGDNLQDRGGTLLLLDAEVEGDDEDEDDDDVD